MQTADVPHILPCPWCGSPDTSLSSHSHAHREPCVWCSGCGAVGPVADEGKDRQAVGAWNRLSSKLGWGA